MDNTSIIINSNDENIVSFDISKQIDNLGFWKILKCVNVIVLNKDHNSILTDNLGLIKEVEFRNKIIYVTLKAGKRLKQGNYGLIFVVNYYFSKKPIILLFPRVIVEKD